MYLSFYYLGGAVGSIIPSIVYAELGWNFTIYMFLVLLAFAFLFVFLNRNKFEAFN
jgi:YNFM family putative membrane transporter